MADIEELRAQFKAATNLATNDMATQAQRVQAMADMARIGEEITQYHKDQGDALVEDARVALAPINAQLNAALNNLRTRP